MALPVVTSLQECADFSKTVAPYAPQLYALPSEIAARITDRQGLQTLYAQTNPLVSSLAFALLVSAVALVLSEFNKNYSQIDRLWSILPGFYNVHYAVWASVNGLPTSRVNYATAVCVLWSVRLTFNYWRKGGYAIGSEDYRWLVIKDQIGPVGMVLFNIVFISLVQSLLLWSITLPTYVLLLTSRVDGNSLSTYDTLFSRAMFVLVVFEYIADGQQWDYYQAKAAYAKTAKVPADKKFTAEQLERGFNTSGLFAWSRHPNFAAEQAFWVCLYQWSCLDSGTYFNWTAVGAVSYLLLFQGSTGFTETLSSSKYPEYKIYQERVGRFFPKLNTKSMETPLTAGERQRVNEAKETKRSKQL